LCRPAERPRKLGTSILLVGVFALLALATRIFCLDPHQSSAFWPANGALVVAMLILPWRSCLPVLVACFGANIVANMLTDYSAFDSWLYAISNILVSWLVAVQTRRFCGATTDLTRFRRLASFGCIVFGSAALEAGIGETLLGSSDPLAAQLTDWLQWTMCDGFGLLIATPAILLALKTRQNDYPCEAGPLERWCLVAAAAALTTVSFLFAHSPLFLLIYPLLILTALRAGPPWVLSSILMTAMISSGLTAHGYGPFAFLASNKILFGQSMVQPFLISIFLTAVPANNALGEKARASRRLMRMKTIVEHTATHDGLTTLVNRDLFCRRLGAMLNSASPCAVLFIDLDRFKYINDTLGHGAGDELLRAFSGRVLEVAGAEATVARFGGDEFAVLVPCADGGAGPEELCRRITQVARQPFLLAKGPAHVSASVGLAVASGGGMETGELMRKADIALYAVKAAGRDGYRIFSDSLDRLVRDKAAIETDLRHALHAGGQLEMHYQAKVDAHGVVRGVETLLRWSHPGRGMVAPNVIIEVAEETGLIIPLGDWVMREALAFAARWPQLNVSVNVSPVQLRHPRFVAETLRAYGHAQLSYGRLEVEVTETALMDDLHLASANLAALRAAGIRVALDDFGTGYSSLRHLHRCAVDRVKIDQSFVSGLDASHEAAAITRAVIQLGHAMGLQVTAEGVETEAQRRFLLEAGVDELQGFLFSQPLDETGFAAMIRAQKPHGSSALHPEYVLIRGGLA
jgi:diguanylate cyclase (GGDEF)-like protein